MTLSLVQSFESLLSKFCEDCELRGMSEETVRRYRSSILIFAEYVSSKGANLYNIGMESLKDFLRYLKNDREVEHKTVENYFSALSAFSCLLIPSHTL